MDNTPHRVNPFSLTVASFNANGLARQIDLVREFVKNHSIDILLVQETLLKPCRRNPRIANYNIIRNDRSGRPLGGTLIYYKRSLHVCPIDTPVMTNMEASVCHIGMTGHQPIVLASVYLSPNKELLRGDLEALLNLSDSVILAGDINASHTRWGSTYINRIGVALDSLTDQLNINLVAPYEPTRFPHSDHRNQRPNILDMALLRGVTLALRSVEVIHELDSDHRPVLFKLGPTQRTTQLKKIVDWKKFNTTIQSTQSEYLTQIPDQIETASAAVAAASSLTNHIKSAIESSSREIPDTYQGRWELPEELRDLLRRKNAATRRYDRHPTVENRRSLRALQRDVKRRIAEFRGERWDRLLGEISPSHLAYWPLARALKNETNSVMPPLIRPNLPPAFLDAEKADCLADSVASQCSPSREPSDDRHIHLVESEVERRTSLPPAGDLITPTDFDEVKTLVKNLHAKKAPGPDGISNKVIKLLPDDIIGLLVCIFNALLAACVFPDAWKEANVIGIHKPGKSSNLPSSYRPISLLNSFAKIYERIILARLKIATQLKGIPIDEQFGFREAHSCPEQVYRLTEYILNRLNRHKPVGTGALFFDIAKAFDKVWHSGLIYKLYEAGIPDRLVRIIRDYLSNRQFRFRVEGTLSSPRPIMAGVPQGSVLSPHLFCFYTHDIPKTPGVELALYADDTALYTSAQTSKLTTKRLQVAAVALGEWFRKWRIEVNPEKSAAAFFYKHNRLTIASDTSHINPKRLKPIKLYNRDIPWQKTVKYLGVTLDTQMTFKPHIQNVRNKAKYVLSRLFCFINKKSKMSLRHKVTLYKTVIRPVMTYASIVFAHTHPRHIHRLQAVQNKFMRMATGSPWYIRNIDLHKDLELPTLQKYFKEASQRHFEKAMRHPNQLVRIAADYTPAAITKIKQRRPRHVLSDPDDPITIYTSQFTHTPRRRRRRRRPPLFRPVNTRDPGQRSITSRNTDATYPHSYNQDTALSRGSVSQETPLGRALSPPSLNSG